MPKISLVLAILSHFTIAPALAKKPICSKWDIKSAFAPNLEPKWEKSLVKTSTIGYYNQLLEYRQHPTAREALRLEAEFDALFGAPSGYAELDKRIASTRSHKGELLLVLKFPELPLHNNPAELAARGRVRKRDVSFPGTARQGRCGPRTEDGKQAWDTFMTLAATTKKLNVSFYEYVRDRILKKNIIPPLSELIQKAARELMQRQLYSLACP
jgi:hypothetical protein